MGPYLFLFSAGFGLDCSADLMCSSGDPSTEKYVLKNSAFKDNTNIPLLGASREARRRPARPRAGLAASHLGNCFSVSVPQFVICKMGMVVEGMAPGARAVTDTVSVGMW